MKFIDSVLKTKNESWQELIWGKDYTKGKRESECQ